VIRIPLISKLAMPRLKDKSGIGRLMG